MRALRIATALPLVLVCAACSPPWTVHQEKLAQYQQSGDWEGAMEEAQWMIDNSLLQGPPGQRSPDLDADRYLLLADCATRAGKTKVALEALRQALFIDPACAPSVRKKLDRLPLPPAERARMEADFSWNMAALAPHDLGELESQRGRPGCWSYRVRQIRVRSNRVEHSERGKEQKVIYDARPWRFDAEHNRWVADGPWIADAGEEIQVLGAAEQPRYNAIVAANGGFYTDSTVPPCHRDKWRGPYAENGTCFTTGSLPQSSGE